MKFSKRHYIVIADALKYIYGLKATNKDTVKLIINELLKVFKEDNERFNKKTFVKYITC